uniref:Uncharacterized protein n=1 Tax=Rhizophagus irregularis (strain DAOM 181602 / DAOM 197198 / MUCL 43194) TaxID=747089 RepID=U9UPS1_RHIID
MPTFDYMRFFIRITPFWIIDMAHLLIKNHKNHSHKKQILEREIYKLIFNWQEWEKCLNNIKKFPHLTRLQTSCLPFNIESLIIEKSGGKILEIDSRQSLKFLDYTTENKNLIITISKNCPLLTRLTIDVDHKNLDELSMMFSNCKQLEEIYFTTPVKVLPTGNDLLKVINNSPLNKLRNISFSDKWNFSIEGVENFLKDWKSKNRLPIKFTPHYHSERNFYWTAEHDRLIKFSVYQKDRFYRSKKNDRSVRPTPVVNYVAIAVLTQIR